MFADLKDNHGLCQRLLDCARLLPAAVAGVDNIFSKVFSEVAKAAKVNCTFHDLRHDHATRLFAGGWHPKDVQDRLGHANISMTMDIYTHHIPERQNGIAAWLEKTMPPIVKKQ